MSAAYEVRLFHWNAVSRNVAWASCELESSVDSRVHCHLLAVAGAIPLICGGFPFLVLHAVVWFASFFVGFLLPADGGELAGVACVVFMFS